MNCDTSMVNWNNSVHVVAPRRSIAKSDRSSFEIEPFTSARMYRVAQAKWQILASPFKPRPAAPKPDVNAKAISLLDDWLREDEGDQKETWKNLTKALDENRLSKRKLFS